MIRHEAGIDPPITGERDAIRTGLVEIHWDGRHGNRGAVIHPTPLVAPGNQRLAQRHGFRCPVRNIRHPGANHVGSGPVPISREYTVAPLHISRRRRAEASGRIGAPIRGARPHGAVAGPVACVTHSLVPPPVASGTLAGDEQAAPGVCVGGTLKSRDGHLRSWHLGDGKDALGKLVADRLLLDERQDV